MMRLSLVAALLVFGLADAAAQTAAEPPPASPPAKGQAPPATLRSSDYLVGPQDVISVTVYGEPQLSGPVRIDDTGTFPFQYIGRVKADGLTTAQIEASLRKSLGDGYLRNPQISVQVLEYHSQSVYVTGEVRLPNKYSVQGDSTLMDVLTLAGILPSAGNYVLITHAKAGVGKPLAPAPTDAATADVRINLKDIQTGKASNIRVRDGDTVYVPKAERIFVLGAVRNPGMVTYEEGMTVHQAVSLAGGITEKGSNRYAIRRQINGQLKEFEVRAEDFVQPDDSVVVRNRRL